MAYVVRTKRDTIYELEFKGSKLQVCPLTNKESSKLRKDFTTTKITRNGTEEKTDIDGMLLAKFKKMVRGWDFIEEDGNALECNDATKAEFMDLNIGDALEIITQIDDLGAKQEVSEEKNS